MGWFEKLRAAFARFMSGRHGVDQLSYTMVIVALVMTVVAMIFGWGWLTLIVRCAARVGVFPDAQQEPLQARAGKCRLFAGDAEGPCGGEPMGQPREERQEIPLLHLPQVQEPAACAARGGQCDDHLQELRHEIRQESVMYKSGWPRAVRFFGRQTSAKTGEVFMKNIKRIAEVAVVRGSAGERRVGVLASGKPAADGVVGRAATHTGARLHAREFDL